MKIEELISNKEYLEALYTQFILKRLIIKKGNDLSKAHIAKSDSNVRKVNCSINAADNCEQLSFSEHPENPKKIAPFKVQYTQGFLDMEFASFLLDNNKFIDWTVVGLYYSVYHAALALVSRKGYSSKEHNATLCFLIKNFSEFSVEEISLIDELQIKREEIEFYSGLKEERNKASYSTSLIFNKEKVYELREKSILLINKIKSILER